MIIDIGKVAITAAGNWNAATTYERLTLVVNDVQGGGDGCGYISLADNVGVRPGTDDGVWRKASEAGASIYDLCVARGFVGTEDEFVQQYNDAVSAAVSAAATASQTNAAISEAEALRAAAEAARIEAEAARDRDESARAQAESSRAQAEQLRVSAENTRTNTFTTQMAAAATATTLAGEKAAEANEAAALAQSKAAEAAEAAEDAEAAGQVVSGYENRLAAVESGKASIADLKSGAVVPALTGNLESWEDRDALSVEDSWSDAVRTTAGDTSIVSDEGARIVSIAALTNFYASAFRATGFNLLHGATAIGSGYYFLVPTLEFGTFGAAIKNNGILFTDANGDNLRPTVRFKALADGVPTSVNNGTACTYVDSNGYRFYTTPGPGYLIVSGITLANTCAHIGWSRRYGEFISPSSDEDAGSSVVLSSLIHAVHSYDLLLAVGDTADRIDFGDDAAVWTRNCDRVQPSWATTANEDGSYTHTATISAMKSGSTVACGSLSLVTDGTAVSYTDNNAAATSDYVYYQLAVPATGSVAISPALAVEDWGLELLDGVSGSAIVTTRYAQSYPDSLAALVASIDSRMGLVISEAFAAMEARIARLESELGRTNLGIINVEGINFYNSPAVLESSVAGAPSASNVPKNWDEATMGVWGGFPLRVGQVYVDKVNKKVYYAYNVSGATGDWVLLN